MMPSALFLHVQTRIKKTETRMLLKLEVWPPSSQGNAEKQKAELPVMCASFLLDFKDLRAQNQHFPTTTSLRSFSKGQKY